MCKQTKDLVQLGADWHPICSFYASICGSIFLLSEATTCCAVVLREYVWVLASGSTGQGTNGPPSFIAGACALYVPRLCHAHRFRPDQVVPSEHCTWALKGHHWWKAICCGDEPSEVRLLGSGEQVRSRGICSGEVVKQTLEFRCSERPVAEPQSGSSFGRWFKANTTNQGVQR